MRTKRVYVYGTAPSSIEITKRNDVNEKQNVNRWPGRGLFFSTSQQKAFRCRLIVSPIVADNGLRNTRDRKHHRRLETTVIAVRDRTYRIYLFVRPTRRFVFSDRRSHRTRRRSKSSSRPKLFQLFITSHLRIVYGYYASVLITN